MRDASDRLLLGNRMGQHVNVLTQFNKFFTKEEFDTVIELGSGTGVFSLFLSFCRFVQGFKFYTFDYKNLIDKDIMEKINYLGGIFEVKDVLSEESIAEIGFLIQRSGKVLLLCDNGNKKREVAVYSKFLKQGDFIMAHDYFESLAKFDNTKWGSCEIVDKDIESSCTGYNLSTVYKDIFDKVFWLCRKKVN